MEIVTNPSHLKNAIIYYPESWDILKIHGTKKNMQKWSTAGWNSLFCSPMTAQVPGASATFSRRWLHCSCHNSWKLCSRHSVCFLNIWEVENMPSIRLKTPCIKPWVIPENFIIFVWVLRISCFQHFSKTCILPKIWGFYLSSGSVALIFFSQTNDQSSCKNTNSIVNDVYPLMNHLKTPRKTFAVGTFGHQLGPCCRRTNAWYIDQTYFWWQGL